MIKMYQFQWHGINFKDLTALSGDKLPDAGFYSRFYDEFFRRYVRLDELDPEWVRLKMQMKEFLKQNSKFKKESAILSIGCGLGFVERALAEEGFRGIEVTEICKGPLQWLLPHFPAEKVHTGIFPGCLPEGRFYDFIYLAGVESFFTQPELIDFLKSVKGRLFQGGRCLIISWSFRPQGTIARLVDDVKRGIRSLLVKAGLKKRGQLWAYIRDRKEFYQAMTCAGFSNVKDGCFDKITPWGTYWIEGDK